MFEVGSIRKHEDTENKKSVLWPGVQNPEFQK